MMRKTICALMCALLLLSFSNALADSIVSLPSELNADDAAGREVRAKITAYDGAIMTIELYDAVMFSGDAVHSLKVGDTVSVMGQETAVNEIAESGGIVSVNGESEDGLLLLPYGVSGNYEVRDMYDYPMWVKQAEIAVPIPDGMLFIDDYDENEDIGDKPVLLTSDEFSELLGTTFAGDKAIAFNAANVFILFDENNLPKIIRRVYVPWG